MSTFGEIVNAALDMSQRRSRSDRNLAEAAVRSALDQVAVQTLCFVKSATVTFPASTTGDYRLGIDLGLNDLLAIRELTGGMNTRGIVETSLSEIQRLRRVQVALTNRVTYCLSGKSLLHLWPILAAGSTLTMVYAYKPAALVDDDEVPDLAEGFHELLVLGAAYRLAAGGPLGVPGRKAMREEYDDQMRDFRRYLNVRSSEHAMQAEVGYTDRPGAVVGNGVDTRHMEY